MSKMRFEKKQSGKIKTHKGFYIALAICLVAVGAATWTTINSINETPPLYEDGSTSSSLSDWPADDVTGANNTLSDIPDTSSENSAQSTPETSSAPDMEEETTSNAGEEAGEEVNAPVAGFFVMPVSGDIIKPFSVTELQYSATYKDYRLHTGIDIAASAGTEVKTAGDGTVEDVYTDNGWGTTVVIDHGNGIKAYYCGLNKKPAVNKGDTVESGKVIGSVDSIPCESVDEVHLHFAVKKDDQWVNPQEIISTVN